MILGIGIAPKGREFDNAFAKIDMNQAKPSPDNPRIAKQLPNLVWAGIGRDVVVLGRSTQEVIPDAPTDQIAPEARPI